MRVAGHYTATYNGASIGSTREGFTLGNRMHHQPVIDDSFGEMEADGVQQGCDTTLELDYIDYDLMQAALFAQTGGEGLGNAKVGNLLSGLGKAIVLTPVAGTPAASQTTPVYTFPLATIVDDVPTLLASKLRQGRVRFHVWPSLSTGVTYTRA